MENKWSIFNRALKDSFIKMNPKIQIENPVMMIVYLGAIITTVLFFTQGLGTGNQTWFTFSIALILWLTILFANFSEAIAEGRGKAQADSLKQAREDVTAKKIKSIDTPMAQEEVLSSALKKGDLVYVVAGEQIPMDGEVVEGAASVDESAITGESAPVIRESGGDRSAVTGGTTLVSDHLIIEVTAESGNSFLDKMISMVEGTERKKTPNEIGLQIFLITLTIIFLVVSATLYTFTDFSSQLIGKGEAISITTLTALLVCLAPTTIGALVSSIGIAGMSRLNKENVVAMSGRAIEAAGDVDILLLDKTGTITLGNRRASEFRPVAGIEEIEVAKAAQLSSASDETAEGRSIVVLATEKFGLEEHLIDESKATFIEFSAKTRMSGIDYEGQEIRKGAADTMKQYVEAHGGVYPDDCDEIVADIAKVGGTPLVVVKN
ncbi:MAG: potassium-transporting ATPase subunit KdpB, partial [Vagococcus sp.]